MSLHRIIFFGGYRSIFVGLKNFRHVLNDGNFWWSTWVTIRFTAETVVLTMLIGLGLALMLNRPIRGGGLVRTLIFLPWCVSLYATGLMFAYMARGQTGLGTSIAYALGSSQPLDLMTSQMVIEVLAVGRRLDHVAAGGVFCAGKSKDYSEAALRPGLAGSALGIRDVPKRDAAAVAVHAVRVHLDHHRIDHEAVRLRVRDDGGGPGRASATLTYQVYKISFKISTSATAPRCRSICCS